MPADPYLAQLSSHYLKFSESEAAQYDWASSQHFAEKGLKAAYGTAIMPEPLEHWNIPAAKREGLRQGRMHYDALITDAVKQSHPKQAADALFYYDCWIEQQEENWQSDHIDGCKRQFEQALEAIGHPERVSQSVSSVAAIELDPSINFSTSSIVYFGWGQKSLSDKAQKALKQVSDYVKKLAGRTEIVLHGHTDRSGEEMYNMELSHLRTEMVMRKLMEYGIDINAISVFAFGESDPKVATPDGQAEPANRRVEIFIE